jgi:hypothetical protein
MRLSARLLIGMLALSMAALIATPVAASACAPGPAGHRSVASWGHTTMFTLRVPDPTVSRSLTARPIVVRTTGRTIRAVRITNVRHVTIREISRNDTKIVRMVTLRESVIQYLRPIVTWVQTIRLVPAKAPVTAVACRFLPVTPSKHQPSRVVLNFGSLPGFSPTKTWLAGFFKPVSVQTVLLPLIPPPNTRRGPCPGLPVRVMQAHRV